MPPSQLQLEERRCRDDAWLTESASARDAGAQLSAPFAAGDDRLADVVERDVDPAPAEEDALSLEKEQRNDVLNRAGKCRVG